MVASQTEAAPAHSGWRCRRLSFGARARWTGSLAACEAAILTSMNSNTFYRLGAVSVLDLIGNDASQILNNLTTNDIASLASGQGCESFVTNVRGKTLGHVQVFRTDEGYRCIGPAGQSERLAEHADRYTIREDAEPRVLDTDFAAALLAPGAAAAVPVTLPEPRQPHESSWAVTQLGALPVQVYRVPWLGEGSLLLLALADQADELSDWLGNQRLAVADEAAFHQARVPVGFPWYGIDVDESNLPQEADRDAQALSFTKGCYLGQETVARLDALGQVQKKLVRWSIAGAVPAAGTALVAGEKTVGRLTSVAASGEEDAVAIGMARRSHFDPGAAADGTDEATGQTFAARVL